MSRPEVLNSRTYKIRPPLIDESLYVTISDCDGRPTELFINSKHMESYPWISYMTRSVSTRLQKGEDVKQIIKEMKETCDTNGGYIIPKSKGKRANSIVAHVGFLFERHMEELADGSTSTGDEAGGN